MALWKNLNANEYWAAIEKLRMAIAPLDPQQFSAHHPGALRKSNNYGLDLRRNPKEALEQFHRALFIDPENFTTVQNLNGILRMMGKDPDDFDLRVALGDEERYTIREIS